MFVRQLPVLKQSPCAINCLFALFSLSNVEVLQNMKEYFRSPRMEKESWKTL